jgi:hypothetical protein
VGAQVSLDLRFGRVWVVHYTHKHGTDLLVCTTEKKANEVAQEWASQQVEDDWDDEDKAKFNALENGVDKLDLFHNVEANTSYGSVIETMERELIE